MAQWSLARFVRAIFRVSDLTLAERGWLCWLAAAADSQGRWQEDPATAAAALGWTLEAWQIGVVKATQAGLIHPTPEGLRCTYPPRSAPRVAQATWSAEETPGQVAQRLARRHAACFRSRFGVPFPVSWSRDVPILTRLLQVYDEALLTACQDAYFTQPDSAFAAKRAWSIPQFAAEAPGLAARHAVAADPALRAALEAEGVSAQDAAALCATYPAERIRRQLAAHARRKATLTHPAGALIAAIRDNWPEPDTTPAPSDAPAVPTEIQPLVDQLVVSLRKGDPHVPR